MPTEHYASQTSFPSIDQGQGFRALFLRSAAGDNCMHVRNAFILGGALRLALA